MYHTMVAAPDLNALIVIGGYTMHGVDDDVWMIDLDAPSPSWVELAPAGTGPSMRVYPSGVWDPVHDQVVLFGGVAPGTLQLDFPNDVWALRFEAAGPRWVQLHAGGALDAGMPPAPLVPPGRINHVAGYDPATGRLIVHGGVDLSGFWAPFLSFVDGLQWQMTGRALLPYALGDAWAFDLETLRWTQLSGDGPRVYDHHGAVDPVSGQLVVTGGVGPGDTPGEGFRREETFGLDLDTGTWTEWQPAGQTPAPAEGAYAYSETFGGLLSMTMEVKDEDLTDPRELYGLRFGPAGQGSAWVVMPYKGTPARALFGMRGTILGDRLFTMGGFLGGFGDPKAWRVAAYDVGEGRWERPLKGVAPVPSTRAARGTYDADRDRFVSIGGIYNEGPAWQLELGTGGWSRFDAAGGPRSGIPLQDPWNNQLLVFEGCLDRAWAETASGWDVLATAGDPPPICGPHVVVDHWRERIVVFGGHIHGPDGSFSIQNKDAFALELSPSRPRPLWHRLQPTGTFKFPSAVPAVFDPHGDRAIYSAETGGKVWSLDFSSSREGEWREIPATGTAAATHTSARAFDIANNRLIAYDGCGDAKVRALELSGEPAWRELATTSDPPRLCETTAAYDSRGKRFLIYSGSTQDGFGNAYATNASYALPLGGDLALPPRPTDPAPVPDPAPGQVIGGTWSSWGPAHVNGQDVDLAGGEALVASTSMTYMPPRGAGVYRSTDQGRTWAVSAGDVVGTGTTELARSPADPGRVYAAGIASGIRGSRYGLGMYVSEDGGRTWRGAGRGLPRDSYWAVAAHTTDPLVAWAAGMLGGLYRTNDGGASWREVSEDELDGLAVNALEVTRAPDGGVRLLAGVREFNSNVIGDGGVYRSDDGGRTWVRSFATHDQFVKALAVDPSDPDRVVAAEGYGVWRSDDAGTTWTHVNGGTWEEHSETDVHLGAIEFDPTSNGRVLWGGGLPSWPCDYKDGVTGGAANPPFTPHLYRSADGGRTWTEIDDLPMDLWCGLAVSEDGRTIIASGQYDGLWRSDDGGQTWSGSNEGISQVYVPSVAPHPTRPGSAVAALGDFGAWVTEDGGQTWERTLGDEENEVDVRALAASSAKPGRVIALESYGASISEDGGRTWVSRDLPALGGIQGFPAPPAMHPTHADTWYFQAYNAEFGTRGVGITRDNGRSYEFHDVVDQAAVRIADCPQYIALDPTQPQRLFVGDRCGKGVFRSDDGGTTWRWLSDEVTDAYVTALAVNPSDPSEIWFGTEHGGVYRSGDGGETWAGVRTPDLGYREVRSIAISPTDPQRVFASAIDHGIYETNDDGASWTKVADGMPSRAPLGLTFDPQGRLFAGTWTAGVMVLA